MAELLGSLSPLSWLRLSLEYKLELVFQVFSASQKRDKLALLYILFLDRRSR